MMNSNIPAKSEAAVQSRAVRPLLIAFGWLNVGLGMAGPKSHRRCNRPPSEIPCPTLQPGSRRFRSVACGNPRHRPDTRPAAI